MLFSPRSGSSPCGLQTVCFVNQLPNLMQSAGILAYIMHGILSDSPLIVSQPQYLTPSTASLVHYKKRRSHSGITHTTQPCPSNPSGYYPNHQNLYKMQAHALMSLFLAFANSFPLHPKAVAASVDLQPNNNLVSTTRPFQIAPLVGTEGPNNGKPISITGQEHNAHNTTDVQRYHHRVHSISGPGQFSP